MIKPKNLNDKTGTPMIADLVLRFFALLVLDIDSWLRIV